MGYTTNFHLEISDFNENDISDGDVINSNYVIGLYGRFRDMFVWDSNILMYVSRNNYKWYDYVDDMTEFSKQYPDFIFTLYGYGEENSDIWVNYFQNGYVEGYVADIVFPSFRGQSKP